MENLKDDMISKSWNKVYETATKSGYREGIAAGRDSTYQKYFDIGYSEGFRNGFVLGMYKSLLRSKHNFDSDVLLQKTTRGNCEICKNNKLLDKSTSGTANLQINSTKMLLETLDRKYNQEIKIDLSTI